MNLFEITISPFLFIIKQLFMLSYNLTNNYGLSIILLSFGISLLLLPIFILIEKAKKHDDAVKRKMKPQLDEIKRCYKGQERYYYIKTLNRQYNFSPIRSLIPILSLLLQIPFFIAAYQFLEHYEPLAGVSFLFINDLSAPDALFGVVNFLPIAMTLVNLLTAYFYTRYGDTSERKQMLGVAAVFLVLLFNLPSGLVLYWTMNNVFSFFRLFVTNGEVFKKREAKKLKFALSDSFMPMVKIKPTLYIGLLFLAIYFYTSSQFYYSDVNPSLAIIALLPLAALQFVSIINIIQVKKTSSPLLYWISLVFLCLILIYQGINIQGIKNDEAINFTFLNFHLKFEGQTKSNLALAGFLFILICIPFYRNAHKLEFSKNTKTNWPIYLLSTFYITALVFFWNPIIVYSSEPQSFNFPAIHLISNNFIPFALISSIAILLYLVPSKKLKYTVLQFIVTLVVIAFLYNSIIPFNVGTLQGNFFSEERNLEAQLIYYLLEALLLLTVIYGVNWILKKQYFRQITYTLIILHIFLSGQSILLAIQTNSFLANKPTISLNQKKSAEISFSKEKENIVIFVIDGAQGWYMKTYIEEDSSLLAKYDGFTYYPNTLSASNFTYASVPSMMCGNDFSIGKMNEDFEKTITEKITIATELFYEKIKSKGYYFSSNTLKFSRINSDKFDNHIPDWDDEWSEKLELGKQKEIWYSRLWENALFTCSPLFIKPRIYNERRWVLKDNFDNTSSEFNKYHFVKVLPKISNAESTQANFIYIHSMFTHDPLDVIDESNKLHRDVSPYHNQKWFTYLFPRWIEWMKANKVYDNTKIILVSDHGPSWWHQKGKIDVSLTLKKSENAKLMLEQFLKLNPLLLVKDFNKTGKMSEDWRLMSNSDTHAIAFDENDPTKMDSSSRTLQTFYTQWHTDLSTRKKYHIKFAYDVNDYIFDLNNWKRIE